MLNNSISGTDYIKETSVFYHSRIINYFKVNTPSYLKQLKMVYL